jgi:ketosteroid isomerase-like protein
MAGLGPHAVAARLSNALTSADLDALASLYAPDAIVWHSTDQVEMRVNEVLDLVRALQRIADCTVTVSDTLATDKGFVQTQKNTYTFRDGKSTAFHAALVATLDSEGRITRLEEYLDSAGLAPLLKALSP